MQHILEKAPSARSQCRGCGRKIDREELRFGERRENLFGGGEATLWFHPLCAAYTRPEPLIEFMEAQPAEEIAHLRATAELGVSHSRLTRLRTVERAPTGRATCRHCQQLIERGRFRLALMFFDEFRFNAAGFIHARCAAQYLGTSELTERITHFNPEIAPEDLEEILTDVGQGGKA